MVSRATLAILSLIASTQLSMAQGPVTEPGGTATDTQLAITNPDEYAWRLFLFMNRQASDGTAGVADPAKSIVQYDPDKAVVWESWALASGLGPTQQGSEVYKPGGEKPGEWKDLPRSAATPVAKVFSVPTKSILTASRVLPLPAIAPLDPLGQEVRMNEATFTFVRNEELYFRQGLRAKLALAQSTKNPSLINFPAGAKEVKAQWEKLDMSKEAEEKRRFHWRKVGDVLYKLAAFHIITKDLPNWFWTDFVHVDYEHAGGAVKDSRDTTTRPSPGVPTPPARGTVDGERRELTNSKWANYRLRGTQINFIDARGAPIILGNGEIETSFPDGSSCMGCHARATIGAPGAANPPSPREDNNVKPPDPDLFGTGGAIIFLQTDFIWSAPIRAQPRP